MKMKMTQLAENYKRFFNEDLSEGVNLKADHLSSAEYQKAKKLKGFNADDWKWNSDTDLYDKVDEARQLTLEGKEAEGQMAAVKGKKYEENPYKKGTKDHLEWSKGHNQARASKLGMREYDSDDDEVINITEDDREPGLPPSPFEEGDGWNEEALEDVGLMYVLDGFSKMAYEIKNARRGSYGISGDTAEDLVDDLKTAMDDLNAIIRDIENQLYESENVDELSTTSAGGQYQTPYAFKKKKDEINERKYKLGDKWSSDFDYEGMLEMGANATIDMGLEALQKLYNSFEDVNYHSENEWLGYAIEELEDAEKASTRAAVGFKKKAEKWLKKFNEVCREQI